MIEESEESFIGAKIIEFAFIFILRDGLLFFATWEFSIYFVLLLRKFLLEHFIPFFLKFFSILHLAVIFDAALIVVKWCVSTVPALIHLLESPSKLWLFAVEIRDSFWAYRFENLVNFCLLSTLSLIELVWRVLDSRIIQACQSGLFRVYCLLCQALTLLPHWSIWWYKYFNRIIECCQIKQIILESVVSLSI